MQLTLTDQQKQELVDAAVADIRAQAIKNATDNLTSYTRSAISQTIYQEVEALVKAEVVPAVKEAILEHKPVLVEAAILASQDMVEKLRQAMVGRLTKKLASEYEARALLKSLFD